jgi:AcrR family transcriptional regulator
MAPRKYDQHLRAETAEETRRRILDAVYERLQQAPSEKVSVDQVARMARVARSTVYLVFGSRAGLFDALARDVFDRGGFEVVIAATMHPDPREHLRGGITGGVRTFAAHRDVFRALHSMSALDPDALGGAIQQLEERRAAGMAYLAGRLDEHGLLRREVTPEVAADMLWVLTSFDSFDLLYTGRGLSADETADELATMAERTLLA